MGDVEQKINDLSVMEQSIQHLLNQKQSFQNQLLEIETALKEINQDSSYKIIGNFMFKKDPEDLKKELEEKQGLLKVRIKSFDAQEVETEKKFKKLQEEVLKELSKKEEKK